MTCYYYPLTCKICGTNFELPLPPILHTICLRQSLLDNFVCANCGNKTEDGRKFRLDWKTYLDKFR